MVFVLSNSQWRPGKPRPLIPKLAEQGLSKISCDRKRADFCCQGLLFFFFVSWLNYALVSWNSLSIILFGLSGTHSRTDQLQAPGFLNPANKPSPGIQQMILHLRHRLYYDQLAPPAGAKPACWRCSAYLHSVFVHGPHILLTCFLMSLRRVEVTTFKC